MNNISTYIKQRLSLREPLAEALEVLTKLVDKLSLSKPDKQENKEAEEAEYKEYLENQLQSIKEVCPSCRDFERDFPSFAFSIATGIGKTRLMGACIAYLYLTKGIKHFFILAPNLTLYEKLMRDFGDPSYEKYVFKGISEFVHNEPYVITGDNYNMARNLFSENQIQINIFNISKFNTESKEGGKRVHQRCVVFRSIWDNHILIIFLHWMTLLSLWMKHTDIMLMLRRKQSMNYVQY